MTEPALLKKIRAAMLQKGKQPFPFQEEVWQCMMAGKSGLLNAPTGSGKTLALWYGALLALKHSDGKKSEKNTRILWITPLRSLAKDTQKALQESLKDLGPGLEWTVGLRNGDTTSSERSRLQRQRPEALIITPESIHLLLAGKDGASWFSTVEVIVVDEWHDLLGNKRGVQTELALRHIEWLRLQYGKSLPLVWGISATLPDLEIAAEVLHGAGFGSREKASLIKAENRKKIRVETLFPAEIERFPWGGRMGLPMLQEVLEIIRSSKSTLVFTNTRAQTEVWYQNLLLAGPELAGQTALHHSSLDLEIRRWVEEALKENRLKAVVCTSSLDLGVDFAPVETIIQIGSPKDISRILQRAGRSGHGPGRESRLYLVPTHSLELVDAAAVHEGIARGFPEQRLPVKNPMDVLVQWLGTLAAGSGFIPSEVWQVLQQTHAFSKLHPDEFAWCLQFISTGGKGLSAYEDFAKILPDSGGIWRIRDRRTALRHRLSIGTIVGNTSLKIKFMSGGYLGTVEESFFARMKTGDIFWFGGRGLEIVRIGPAEVLVKKAVRGKGSIPSWGGGRMPLSGTFASLLREMVSELATGNSARKELQELQALARIQRSWSAIPAEHEFLCEYFPSREGWHFCFYPFEGRNIHELLASLIAFRIASKIPATFSLAMNDYGFELLSDQALEVEEILSQDLFSTENLEEDLLQSVNAAEMARRKFRDIATIAGLVFTGFPGATAPNRHLQASSRLIYDVLAEYDPENLLLKQARQEVLEQQGGDSRIFLTLQRLNRQKLLLKKPPGPTPLSFPVFVDRLREKLSSESLEDRVDRMIRQLEKAAEGKAGDGRKMEKLRSKEGLDKI
jgi:ATP-dependent Lhr-like helicase